MILHAWENTWRSWKNIFSTEVSFSSRFNVMQLRNTFDYQPATISRILLCVSRQWSLGSYEQQRFNLKPFFRSMRWHMNFGERTQHVWTVLHFRRVNETAGPIKKYDLWSWKKWNLFCGIVWLNDKVEFNLKMKWEFLIEQYAVDSNFAFISWVPFVMS